MATPCSLRVFLSLARGSELSLVSSFSLDAVSSVLYPTSPLPWRSSQRNRKLFDAPAIGWAECFSEPGTPFALTISAMKERGVKLIYGRWLIEGAPRVLLFDTGSCYNRYVKLPSRSQRVVLFPRIFQLLEEITDFPARRMDEWKTDLWNLAGIPTPPNDHETNETIVFGYIVAWFLGEVCHGLMA